MLDPQKVVAGSQALGDLGRDLLGALAGPRQAAGRDAGALRQDLEPHVAGAVPRGGRLARGHLGHVELQGPRVADRGLGAEPDRRPGRHALGLRPLGARRELVAADLLRRHVRRGPVGLVVGRLAHVLPVRGCRAGYEVWERVCLGDTGSAAVLGHTFVFGRMDGWGPTVSLDGGRQGEQRGDGLHLEYLFWGKYYEEKKNRGGC